MNHTTIIQQKHTIKHITELLDKYDIKLHVCWQKLDTINTVDPPGILRVNINETLDDIYHRLVVKIETNHGVLALVKELKAMHPNIVYMAANVTEEKFF